MKNRNKNKYELPRERNARLRISTAIAGVGLAGAATGVAMHHNQGQDQTPSHANRDSLVAEAHDLRSVKLPEKLPSAVKRALRSSVLIEREGGSIFTGFKSGPKEVTTVGHGITNHTSTKGNDDLLWMDTKLEVTTQPRNPHDNASSRMGTLSPHSLAYDGFKDTATLVVGDDSQKIDESFARIPSLPKNTQPKPGDVVVIPGWQPTPDGMMRNPFAADPKLRTPTAIGGIVVDSNREDHTIKVLANIHSYGTYSQETSVDTGTSGAPAIDMGGNVIGTVIKSDELDPNTGKLNDGVTAERAEFRYGAIVPSGNYQEVTLQAPGGAL
ncbi:MAG TPA: hypothetical protein VMY99_05505 [Nevskiaceae bacterium]|nr:hypothetical protein [Nevskiaceae bacterium]